MIQIYDLNAIQDQEIFLRRDEVRDVSAPVADIIRTVRAEGDRALYEYGRRFDGAELSGLSVTGAELEAALEQVEPEFLAVLREAADNIRAYHAKQKRESFVMTQRDGVILGQRILPLARVGIYVPGGTASYPSTVLMNAIPAQIAGVEDIVMVTPPGRDGAVSPAILAAAQVAGVTRIFKCGGAQAIAALAYGTESVPQVDKIVGPGNAYVAEAKKQVFGQVNIDMIAAAAPNDKNQLRVQSEGYDLCVIDLNDLEARKEEENTTAALLRGECAAFTQRGAKLAGLDVYVSSNVPKGSGVSSSAAFEVLIGVILNDCFMTEKVSPIAIAQIGQWAENVYFGKPCGLMDQMASSVGNIITIDFASPAKPVVEPVAVDFSKAGLVLCILDSGADHADLTDEYAAIPAECRAVAAVCGGEVLRDVPFETFLAKLPECRRQCGDRAVLRAFHVYADNDRVAKQVAALHDGDFDTFLCLVNESGRSSWEYLQNVIPAGYKEHQEVGVTIAAAKHLLGDKGAVRVHGGGFAGTVQAFVPVEMLDKFKAGMEAILGEGRCHVLSIRPEGGAVL